MAPEIEILYICKSSSSLLRSIQISKILDQDSQRKYFLKTKQLLFPLMSPIATNQKEHMDQKATAK